ncbi:MAG TPA: DUF3105 domain-containing protein [Nitriliruptorales bacterium]|nr:DUF3105 domain-containing protein [Nitriliruptorales bacterium]
MITRRASVLPLLPLVPALLAGACSSGQPPCGEVEHPPLQGGGHLIGDAPPPGPYSSTPGTSGWHAGGAPRTGVFGGSDALSEPELVLALESGQVVAAYAPTLPDDQVAELERLATDRFAGILTVTPFEGDMGAPLVLNAWATRQPCQRVDAGTVATFIDRHADEAAQQGG